MNKFKQHDDFGAYRVHLWLAVLCLIVFFIWASLAQIDQQVSGHGKIIPSGKVRAIQNLEGGLVRNILITEGQIVKPGDTLFQLTNTKARSDMQEITVALNGLLMKQIRLQAEIDGAESVKFPEALIKGNERIQRTENNLFQSRRSELLEKINGFQKRMSQKVLKLDELETTVVNLQREKDIASEQLAIRKRLLNTGAISRSQYLETDSQVKNFTTRISKVKKEIPIIKSELAEIANLIEETKQNWRSKAVEESGQVNIDIKKLRERIKTYSDAVDRTEIKSTISGIVNKVHINTIGGVIQPGQIIAEIIPIEETLIVEGQISTEDRGKIWTGLPVVAKITAYDYSIYGGLEGTLTYISADSFSDNQNRQYYQIRVTFEKAKIADDMPLFPGMTVDVNILAGKISIMNAITKPIYQIRQNALREL